MGNRSMTKTHRPPKQQQTLPKQTPPPKRNKNQNLPKLPSKPLTKYGSRPLVAFKPTYKGALKDAIKECMKTSTDCSNGPHGPIQTWDVSIVTDMSNVFEGAEDFNGDVSEWDTSGVTTMSNMFKGAKKFSCDLSKWDTSEVTDMSGMFKDAKSFTGAGSRENIKRLAAPCEALSQLLKTNMPLRKDALLPADCQRAYEAILQAAARYHKNKAKKGHALEASEKSEPEVHLSGEVECSCGYFGEYKKNPPVYDTIKFLCALHPDGKVKWADGTAVLTKKTGEIAFVP